MMTPACNNRGLAVLAAILITTAATTVAQARIGGLGMGMPMQHGMTTTMAPGWPRGYGAPKYPPPYPPPCSYGRCARSSSSSDQGGGTGGFNPGGGSGSKPIKKPNLQ